MCPNPLPPTTLMGLGLENTDVPHLLDRIFADLAEARGGWLVTANLDILRRYTKDLSARALYDAADLRVADGMPLVWASALLGDALPERIAGSSLLPLFADRAAREGRSVFFVGGAPGTAVTAAAKLVQASPGLLVRGALSPDIPLDPTDEDLEALRAALVAAQPDLLFIGLGSPKQEQVIRRLRPHLPKTWMVGVGISFSFVAGALPRAPQWAQRAGLEWAHRLAHEPSRLAKRYLVEDLPFAAHLFAWALFARALRPRRARAA